jgi:tetratricopeptide (TPR) repeat protein
MDKEGDGLTAQSISYHDFLEETARLLKKSDFTNALSNFTAILARYPSDDNALFYSGFCLYKLKKYQSAMNFFKKSEESVRENFHEEAEWYIFLCYIEMKDIRNATAQGNNIISRNGFYKTQAERLIKQLD